MAFIEPRVSVSTRKSLPRSRRQQSHYWSLYHAKVLILCIAVVATISLPGTVLFDRADHNSELLLIKKNWQIDKETMSNFSSNNKKKEQVQQVLEKESVVKEEKKEVKEEQVVKQEVKQVVLPKACTAEEQAILQHQLPPEQCEITKDRPWVNQCSFSYATRCPDNSGWLETFYQQPLQQKSKQSPRSAIFVGCNKGMDALNALRMLSANPMFEKTTWHQKFAHNQTMQAGHCGQENAPQFEIKNALENADAVVHCIEAMPVTARQLNSTSHSLEWASQFKVTNAAMGATDGYVYFPDSSEKVGIEQQGISNCKQHKPGSHCKQVPMLKLDSFIQMHYPNEEDTIDFVSIDVEGFDCDVLKGANQSLSRIGYLEFEYNWRGEWIKPENSLSSVVTFLKEQHNFVCYWAGAFGNLWRITDCFLPHYDLRHWSNVACVNIDRSPFIYERMEKHFQETLSRGKSLTYKDRKSIDTSGMSSVT